MGLGNMMPLTSDLNRGGKKVQSGYKHDGAVFPCQSQMTGLDSIVQPSWLFSNFLKGVQEGTVNVDVIPSFKKHMSEPFAKMLATHKGLVAEPGNVVHGSFLENYSPPVIPKAPRNTGGTQKTDKGATAFMQIVQGMYSFDGKRTVKEAYVLHEDVSHKALGKFFENLLEEGAVKSVSFHPERLKDLYVTEKTPNDAAGFLVMNHIDKIERASNKKPRAPGKDTPPRSKRPRRTGDHSKSPNSKNSKDRR